MRRQQVLISNAQIGLEFSLTIILMGALGQWIDQKWFNNEHIWLIILGTLSLIIGCYRLIKKLKAATKNP